MVKCNIRRMIVNVNVYLSSNDCAHVVITMLSILLNNKPHSSILKLHDRCDTRTRKITDPIITKEVKAYIFDTIFMVIKELISFTVRDEVRHTSDASTIHDVTQLLIINAIHERIGKLLSVEEIGHLIKTNNNV